MVTMMRRFEGQPAPPVVQDSGSHTGVPRKEILICRTRICQARLLALISFSPYHILIILRSPDLRRTFSQIDKGTEELISLRGNLNR